MIISLQVQAHGLTGPIEFKNGIRTNFHLQLMRLSGGEKGGMVVAGTWSPSEGLTVSDPAAYKRDPPPNVTLTVVTVEVSREIDNKNSISFHCNHLHYRTQNEDDPSTMQAR